jgi:hypothetical protein
MRCPQARRLVLASRDARLSLAERLELDEHLTGCADCRVLDRADAGLEEAVAALDEPPVEQLDLDAAVRAIGARIDSTEGEAAAGRVRRIATWRRLGYVAAAAAVLLVAWSLLGRRGGTPQDPGPIAEGDPTGLRVQEPGASEGPAELPAPAPERAVAEAAPEPSVAGPGPQLELERLERARASVREAFAAALVGVPAPAGAPDPLQARLDAVRAPLEELSDEGWPVTRLAERVVADSDPDVAALAARWLGREGDRLSVGAIASLLRRPDVSGRLREQAVLALLDDGEPAVRALAPALEDPDLRTLALEGLVARGDAVAAGLIDEALGSSSTDPARASELAAALARLAGPGLDALLRAVALPGVPSQAALAQLRRTRGASDRLTELLAERAPARVEDARLLAAAHLGLADALPRLVELARDRGRRARALEALACFDGAGALDALLELWGSGRLPEDALVAAARAQLERDPLQAVALCEEGIPPGLRSDRFPQLLDLLLSTESPAAAPALACLAGSRFLGRDERQWAALALAEWGGEAEARALGETLHRLFPEEDRVAAACALAIHAIAGPDALREVLGPAATRRSDQLIALLERRPAYRSQTATLSRVSRLLEPWLDPDNPERTRTTP